MKICIVTYHQQALDERAYGKLACSLQKYGHEVTRLCIGDKATSYLNKQEIHIVELQLPHFSKNGWLNYVLRLITCNTRRRALQLAVLRQNADVFLLFDFRTHYLAPHLRQQFPSARIVYDVVDPTPQQIIDERPLPWGNRWWAWVLQRSERQAMHCIDHILCTEPLLAADYRKRYPSIPQTILYNYTNLPPNTEHHQKQYDAMYCGLLSPNRGLWVMIDAAYEVKQMHKQFRLLLLGPLDSSLNREQVLQTIKQKNLEQTVILHPPVDQQDVIPFYQQSVIGLLPFQNIPTNKQLLPVKLYEYINYGLPVIAPLHTVMGNEVLQWGVGLCINTQDSQQLASALLLLLSDTNSYNQYQAATRIAAAKTRWELQEPALLSAIFGK